MVRFHPTYHMLIPQLSVGTYVVVFKLIRLLDAPFIYLILWLAFLFVPWWYRCHVLSIWRCDMCCVIEFVLLDTGSFLWLFHTFILRMNVMLFFMYGGSWRVCGYLIPHLHTNWSLWHVLWPVSIGVFLWFWFDRCTNESLRFLLGLQCICVSVHWYEFVWGLFWLRNSSMSFAFD